MEIKFVDYKSETSYIALLAKITFKYCNNYDGRVYTTYRVGDTNNNLIETLINQLTPLIVNKKNTIILNLLVNPFFDDLCDYLSENPKICKNKINLINKYIFSYLSNENTKRLYSDFEVERTDIYINKNIYERTMKMLLLNNR